MDKIYLKDYQNFVSQFNMVGSNVLFLRNDLYKEICSVGYSDLEKNKLSNSKSIYRIASISKVIVAIAIMKLYENSLLDLDEDISKYLGFNIRNPKYPDISISIRMLMTQTSSILDNGIIENGFCKGYDASNSTFDYIKLEELLNPESERYYNAFSDYKPGTTFIYSNLGCGILACICEKVTKVYFTEFIKDILFKPLDIRSGFRLEDIEDIESLCGHYQYDNFENRFSLYRNYSSFKKVQCLRYPLGDNFRGVAGLLYINIEDLSKIMQMLMKKGMYNDIRILNEETVKEMEKVQWEGIPTDPTYRKKGLQMIIMDNFTKDPLKGHFGNAYGLRSFMLYNNNGGIIFLCNGANFISDEEHMTVLQEKVIRFLVEKTNL